MEPEGSLLRSQQTATRFHSKPDESSPNLHFIFLSDLFYYYHSIYTYVSQVVSSFQAY